MLAPPLARIRAPAMPDHPHTIDRWDDATGENLIEQIAGVTDYEVALAAYRWAVRRWPKRQDHAAQPGAGDRAELGGLGRSTSERAKRGQQVCRGSHPPQGRIGVAAS